MEPPRLSIPPTSGRVTKDGTKKIGSHLASNAAPGLRRRCNRLSLWVSLEGEVEVDEDSLDTNKSTARTTPHPPSDEGNLLAMPSL